MYLHDNLQICLYALASRYPKHTIDINRNVIESQGAPLAGWKALEVIKILTMAAPALLQTYAELIIDYGEATIYLPSVSETTPFCTIHCRGKIPPHLANSRNWLKKQLFQPEAHLTFTGSTSLSC